MVRTLEKDMNFLGVSGVEDKLQLYHSPKSKLVESILKETKLGKLTFKTCLAGTVSTVQMLTMLIVELVYHKLYT